VKTEPIGMELQTSETMKAGENRLKQQAFIWVLGGILLILLETNLELYIPSKVVHGEFMRLLERLLEALGIAAIVFGMFSVFLELQGLRRYFLERMKELVIEQAYLGTLSPDELLKLQFNVHRAHFGNNDITREGGFLRFLYRDIYTYINAPYRERVALEIRYEDLGDGLLLAKDRLSYICRMSGGVITPSILWSNDPDEIEEVQDLQVEVRYPQARGGQGKPVKIAELKDGMIYIFDKDGKEISCHNKSCLLGDGLHIDRDESYKNVDHMKVTVDATYKVRSNGLLYWLMSYPTKDFSLTLKFPDSYVVQAATFINSEHIGQLTHEKGYYSFHYHSWMIPQSGVAWRLIPAKDIEPRSAHEQA
jgi:hypothetical protein